MRHPLDGQVLKTIETDLWICAEYKANQVQQLQNKTKCMHRDMFMRACEWRLKYTYIKGFLSFISFNILICILYSCIYIM